MDITDIMAAIPHRYPFLLVDRIIDLEAARAVGIKNVTMNEPFFRGHFPGYPVMPSLLIIEHAAQIGCALLLSRPENKVKLGLFTAMDGVEFHQPVTPGDQLVTEVVAEHAGSRAGKVRFTSRVGDTVVAEGRFTFILAPDPMKVQG